MILPSAHAVSVPRHISVHCHPIRLTRFHRYLPLRQPLSPFEQKGALCLWAASGEIDILEAVNLGGAGGNSVLGTLHYGGASSNNVFSGNEYVVPSSATDEFHDYAIEWGPSKIRWYVDDVLYAA